MTAGQHQVSPEELMAYLDGEVPSERATLIRTHVADCVVCQRTARELKEVSTEMARWPVEATPPTLRAPVQSPDTSAAGWRWSFGRRMPAFAWQFAGVAAAIVLVLSSGVWERAKSVAEPATSTFVRGAPPTARAAVAEPISEPRAGSEGSSPVDRERGGHGVGGGIPADQRPSRAVSPRPEVETPQAAGGPLIVHTVALTIVAKDIDAARAGVERILRDTGGFIGRIDQAGSRGSVRSLTAMLRIPAPRLDGALAGLKQIGQVVGESRAGDDVTEQMVDLTARLSNARNTEKRLIDLLQNRTGKVSDVLEAEREIARVRGEIEHLDAERKNLDRRVTYATVTLTIEEERKAGLDLGPLTLTARLRNALVDGFRAAFETVIGIASTVLRVGPSLALWALVVAWPARILWRRHRAHERAA